MKWKSHNRREFLKAASLTAVGLAGRQIGLSGFVPIISQGGYSASDRYPNADDPLLSDLAAAALDSARAAGATYADIRLSLQRAEDLRFSSATTYFFLQNHEYAGIGVRALVDGAWGFASSTNWSVDEAARLGRQSAGQAKMNAVGRERGIDIGPPLKSVTGEWISPFERDPFDVPLAEKVEVAWAFIEHATRHNIGARNLSVSASMATSWEREERTFASTDGTFISQTLYYASPSFSVGALRGDRRAGRSSDLLQATMGGFEVVTDAPLLDELPRLVEEAALMTEAERIVPDRYDIVVDPRLVSQLVAHTIGTAAELDRVLGYEANAGGTSYLGPPEERLGEMQFGPEFLNIRANRSNPRGVATVRWDDEGVEPKNYDVIRDGVLVDYHTTRELSREIAQLSGELDRSVSSHGCSWSESALRVQMLHPPNLELLPINDTTTLDDLVADMKKGLVISAGSVTTDRQQLNGEINGEMVYEVRNGKRVGFVHSAEALFRAPELWNSLRSVGGRGTQRWSAARVWKGEPWQRCRFSVGGVPAYFERVAVTDKMRKA